MSEYKCKYCGSILEWWDDEPEMQYCPHCDLYYRQGSVMPEYTCLNCSLLFTDPVYHPLTDDYPLCPYCGSPSIEVMLFNKSYDDSGTSPDESNPGPSS